MPAELAVGLPDPARVRRWRRGRFPNNQPLPVGKWVPVVTIHGRRLVRVLEVRGETVVVDTNHHFAGQSLEVELIAILGDEAGAGAPKA